MRKEVDELTRNEFLPILQKILGERGHLFIACHASKIIHCFANTCLLQNVQCDARVLQTTEKILSDAFILDRSNASRSNWHFLVMFTTSDFSIIFSNLRLILTISSSAIFLLIGFQWGRQQQRRISVNIRTKKNLLPQRCQRESLSQFYPSIVYPLPSWTYRETVNSCRWLSIDDDTIVAELCSDQIASVLPS